jgi:hypothetical protein
MSTQYIDFLKQHPYIDEEIRRRRDQILAEGEIEVILQLLRIHFSETMAELVKLALRRVDMRDAEVIGPLKEAALNLDEQGVNRWVKDHLPAE